MFTEYLNTLAMLKAQKFSWLIGDIERAILEKLNSPLFSERLRKYIINERVQNYLTSSGCGLIRMSTDPRTMPRDELKTLLDNKPSYVLFDGGAYYIDGRFGWRALPRAHGEARELEAIFPIEPDTTQYASREQLLKLRALTAHTHIAPEREPFIRFEGHPAIVSQIEKFFNALHHGKIALQGAEEVNLGGTLRPDHIIGDLSTLYRSTVRHAYQAGQLATHFDVDFLEIFGPEIASLTPVLSTLRTYTEPYREATMGRMARMSQRDIPHQAGVLAGTVVDQLDLRTDGPDYEYLALFGAQLPAYLGTITSSLEELSSSVSARAPRIDRVRLVELRERALRLLDELEGARVNSVFLPLQALHYIHAIRHTITLALSIYEQIGHVNETTQQTARVKLEELKKALAALFGLADKIEQNSILEPGTLSRPLINHVASMYKTLVSYVQKFVDFSAAPALLILEDPKFVADRLEHSYDRLATEKEALLILQNVRFAADEFFRILQEQQDRHVQLSELPRATKLALAQHYVLLQPYVLQSDIPLNQAIVTGLLTDAPAPTRGILSYLPFQGQAGIRVEAVLSLRPTLVAQLGKVATSHAFNCDLNTDIISSVSRGIQELKLSPHSTRENPFKIDEQSALHQSSLTALTFAVVNGDNQLSNPQYLTTPQAATLCRFYQTQRAKLETALNAYDDFINELQIEVPADVPASQLLERKNKLRSLYNIFQPYLFIPADAGVVDIENEVLLDLERKIIAALSSDQPQVMPDNTLVLLEPVRERFISLSERLNTRHNVFIGAVQTCLRNDNAAKVLVLAPTPDRAFHFLSHQELSSAVSRLRTYLSGQISSFNAAFRDHLTMDPAATTLPFPGLDDVNGRLAQSSQVLVLKQAFNCLYFLEKVIVGLEQLNDQSRETDYAIQLVQIADNVIKTFLILQSLAKTPYLSPFVNEIKQKLLTVQTTLRELQTYYAPAPLVQTVEGADTAPPVTGYTPTFYVFNTLLFLPTHIAALRVNQSVDPDAARTVHAYAEKVTTDLERIIRNSDSYWKLSTEVLTMYRLFWALKAKLLELTTVSHDIVVDNLKDINDNILTNILLELDRWEDGLSLNAGTLTKPIAEMFASFYQGLLEPLGLDSDTHISLATSIRPIERRIGAVNERLEQAKYEQNIIRDKKPLLKDLLDSIRTYRLSERTGSNPAWLEECKAELVTRFQNALPILNEENQRLSPDIEPGTAASQALDALLLAGARNVPQLANIEALASACFHDCDGKLASYQLTIDTANTKNDYLNNLLDTQPALKTHFVDRYAVASFEKSTAHALSAQRVGLADRKLRIEYADALEKWLEDAKDLILLQAKTDDVGIDRKIEELILNQITAFNDRYYQDYCHLDQITGAVARLRRYVDGQHWCEGVRTMQPKRAAVAQLESLCNEASCGLITMETDPVRANFDHIKSLSAGKNAVILYNDEIFYADMERGVSKIEIGPGRLGEFNKLKQLFPVPRPYKAATRDELSLVNAIRQPIIGPPIPDILECGLVTIQTDPMQVPFDQIRTLAAGKNAVIWYNSEMFYADILAGRVSKIPVNPSKNADFDKLKLSFCQFANMDELRLISSLRGWRTPIISERIENIKHYLGSDPASFERMMCAQRSHTFFAPSWFKQLILDLFTWVGIYTPERKAGYNQLTGSVNNPPAASSVGMFGFFSMESRRSYALPGAEQPVVGAAQPGLA